MSPTIRIGMVHPVRRSFPPDIRIEKEISALGDAGFAVAVLTGRAGPEQDDREPFGPHAVIRRYSVAHPPWARRLMRRLDLQSPEWYGPLADFLRTEAPDVLHVHDLPWLPTVLRVAREHGLPVVADLHENMPAAMRAFRAADPWPRRLWLAAGYNYDLWRMHERRAVRECARVIVVVPEAAERLRTYGLPEGRVVIVSNTEDETTFPVDPAAPVSPAASARVAGRWALAYVGGVGPERGLETVIDALPAVVRRVPEVRLLIVGAGDRATADLRARATGRGVAEHLDVLGWQPFAAVKDYMLASAACIVPHADFEHTQTTVPHKLFQYMLCARPVVVSDVRPLARIVRDADCGLVFRAGDAADCAAQIVRLRADPGLAARLGQHGRAAALGPYAWRHDAARLVALYRQLAADNRRRDATPA